MESSIIGLKNMIKTYTVKLCPNGNKVKKLNSLVSFWRDQVNHKIKVFWEFDEIKSSYPPKEHSRGGRLIRDASVKAWQIVKGAKAVDQAEKPMFDGFEIDLNQFSAYIIPDLETTEFDMWFNVISLEKNKRLKIPGKKTQVFNTALKTGTLKKSFKLIRKNGDYYIECFVEFPEVETDNTDVIGIDVGIAHAAVTSDGIFYGSDVRDLQRRTKHRAYNKGLSAVKQRLNAISKEIVADHPKHDFAVEELLFKGKNGRTKKFRRKHNRWAYNHLSKQLDQIGIVEGFDVIRVNPKYTSQTCPVCGFISKGNRNYESFKCLECGFTGHADHIGAINISERVPKDNPYLKPTGDDLP